jgi:7-cyano-7-deazaguanine synthase
MAAVVLLSGGLDSAVNLKAAADEVGVQVALTFDYGQRAAAREVAAAAAMARAVGAPHRVIALPWLAEICTTALVNTAQDLPRLTAAQLSDAAVLGGETARAVWVPNRNGVFLNIAAAFAESAEAPTVVTGFNAEEAATFPDNSADFVAAANAALAYSTATQVRVMSYTQPLAKPEIVRLGREIGAPLELIWACYRGGEEHCGECESCARLERALRAAGAWGWFLAQRRRPA